jgi:inorganic pyrophosphatase
LSWSLLIRPDRAGQTPRQLTARRSSGCYMDIFLGKTMIREIRIEQTPTSKMRMQYDPSTDSFHTTEYKSLLFERGYTGYYGWITETGTPPEKHLDVLLLSDNEIDIGQKLQSRIIGCFQRSDGDHKFIGVQLDSQFSCYSELSLETKTMLNDIYPIKKENEIWLTEREAIILYQTLQNNDRISKGM